MDVKIKETLMNAVVSGTVECIENLNNLFETHKLTTDDSFFDYELLKIALHRNDLEMVTILLNLGCRVINAKKSKSEGSLLHIVVIQNIQSYSIIKKLINRGASLYDRDVNGETPIFAAFNRRNFDIVREFLWHDSVCDKESLNKDCLLHFHLACVLNEYFCIEKYIISGIDPNCPIKLNFKEFVGLNPIQFAIDKGYLKLFEMLVKYSDLSMKNKRGLTPLLKLYYSMLKAKNKAKNWIEYTFKNGNDTKFINSEDQHGVSHFHLVCMLDEPDFVQAFIDKGVKVNSSVSLKCKINPGFTALHFAVTHDCQKVIKLLLKNGADPNKLDKNGDSPFHLVCKNKIVDSINLIVKMMIEAGANPFIADKNGSIPLHKFFCRKNSEYIKIFNMLMSDLEWGLVNYTDKQGLSLFHIACTTNNTNYQIIRFLNSGVDINSCVTSGIYSGYTALHFAVMYNQKEVVEILLKKNANVNAKLREFGTTPLHLACEFSFLNLNAVNSDFVASRISQLEIIKLLLSYGANVNAKGPSGVTPLLQACMIKSSFYDNNLLGYPEFSNVVENEINIRLKEIIEILVSHKANINSQIISNCKSYSSQSSMLHIISSHRSLKISDQLMDFLIVSGVDVNAVDSDGFTPLCKAVSFSNEVFVRTLLKFNANPNGNGYKVPLNTVIKALAGYGPISAKSKDIFKTLVEYGADVNKKDYTGIVMLQTALSNQTHFLIEDLLNYGADINKCSLTGQSSVSKLLEREEQRSMDNSQYGKMFQIIYIHVQKLLAFGLPVSQEIQKTCTQLYPRYKRVHKLGYEGLKNLENVFDECINELDRMKNMKIDFYTSLYDILLKGPHELAKYVNNDKLTELLEGKNVVSEFPLYSYLLILQFNRGLRRREVLEFAETALKNVLNVHLPHLCYDLVLKYLTNEEVFNLKVAAFAKCKVKRKLDENDPNQAEPKPKLQKKVQ